MPVQTLAVEIERWPLKEPFHITGHVFETIEVLVVSIERDGHIGRGEAAGVYYLDDRPGQMARSIEGLRDAIEAGIDRAAVQTALPPGGARNALDCALWDLDAKSSGRPVWDLAGLPAPKPVVTTFTCGVDTPEQMAARAVGYDQALAIKLKLNGDGQDSARVRAVRAARPEVWLGVDANQGFDRESLSQLMPALLDCGASLIEQPFPVGQEAWHDGLASPIPFAADESVQSSGDLESLVGRFSVINIKLDKCGGLTEALAMAETAKALGFELMVGNMIGTSLSIAPAWLVGQQCSIADLDGPIFLAGDRTPPVEYANGAVTAPGKLWGN